MKRFLSFFLTGVSLLALVAGCHPEPYLNVSPTSLSFPQDGGSQTVRVSANYAWTASISGTGLTVSPTAGEGEGTVTVTAAPATSASEATGSVSFRSEGLSASVAVSQEAKSTITVGATTKIPAEGGTFTVDIQYNTDYTVEVESAASSWISFNGTKALTSGKLEFTFAANDKSGARSGKVTVKDKSGKVSPVTLTFEQEAYVPVSSVTLDRETAEIEKGETLTLKATIVPENATEKTVKWSSDKTSVASVSEAGVVTAVAVGTAVITAKAGGKSAACTVTVVPTAAERERAALMAFYNANKDHWTKHENWGTEGPVTSAWEGVEMDAQEKHVKALNLRGAIGKIPKEIGDLTELEQFTIWSDSEMSYGLPKSTFGPLPEEIGKLKKLNRIVLYDYPLTGKLPEGLFSLSNLQTLSITRTQYMDKSALSPSIGNLKNLTYLQLDDINLSGTLPAEIGKLSNLTWLSLNDNDFTGTVPPSYAGLVNLESFILSNNRLSGNLPASLAGIERFPLLWGQVAQFNNFSQEDIRSSKIPAPGSPAVKTVSGQDLDIEAFIKKNKYTVLFDIAPDFSEATEYLTNLERLYQKGKSKGLGILTYFANNSPEEPELSNRDQLFKDILKKAGAEWDSFIWHMYGDYPDGAPFYAIKGDSMYPRGPINQMVIIGPDGTVDYTTLVDKDKKKDVENALKYLEGVLDVSVTFYESEDFTRDGNVKTLQKAATGKGIDLVITGDAFSDRMIADGTFEKMARQAMNDLFSVEPMKSLKDRFNVFMVEAVSRNEDYFSGCETAFSGGFGGGSAVGGDNGKVLEYAKKAVKDDVRMDNAVVLVLMNSYRDGGTCYMLDPADESIYAGGASVAWVTYKDVTVSGGVSNLANTVVHEAVGHGLGKLADEYAYLAQGGVTENAAAYIRKVQKWNWYLNISLSASSSEVPWSRFVGDDAFASEKIGAYAGGNTFWSGVWRPTEQSVMNDSNNYGSFNAPSRSQIWTRVMKLSEGESWTYDYNAFKAWDKAHPAANTAKRVVKAGEKTHSHVPPVTLRKTWKEIIK